MKSLIFILCIFSGMAPGFTAPLQLASALQSNMVVQQNQPFTVWGRAEPGQTIQISADWTPDAITVIADTKGDFLGILPVPAVRPGDYRPHTLKVSDGSS